MTYELTSETLHSLSRKHPEYAKAIIERHDVPRDMLAKIHVIGLWNQTDADGHHDEPRSISTVLLFDRKTTLHLRGVGVSLKCPEDDEKMSRGFDIALGRAVRRGSRAW